MAENKDSQAAFMEAVGSIKEYAKVNGNIVTREDVHSFFKDMALDDAKFQMISGYLMANGIKIQGEDSVDNEFLKLMESASDDNIDESGQHISKEEQEDKKVADEMSFKYLSARKCHCNCTGRGRRAWMFTIIIQV